MAKIVAKFVFFHRFELVGTHKAHQTIERQKYIFEQKMEMAQAGHEMQNDQNGHIFWSKNGKIWPK